MPHAVSALRATSRHVLVFLLPLVLGLTACGGGGDCIEEDPTTAAPIGTPSTSSPSPGSPTSPPIDDPLSVYLGQWAGPCTEILTETFITIPGQIHWIGEVMVQEPDTVVSQWVSSGRSDRTGVDVLPVRPGVLSMTSTKRVYGTPTCNGAPEEIQQSTISEAAFAGTKFVDGRDTNKFEIRDANGTRLQLMRVEDDRLYEGDFSFGSDSEGYPFTMKRDPSLERQPAAP
ncbi:MAG: hypothetical protein GTN84_18670 [Hydrogenophaga sp.]|uniref:hypothetical protein n=1 Tax=Hydrogenophaga sp. TaxID=1904254 RepID=UPI0016AECF6F|nr:hypothetical protein [Hydrogenophaga sp.]NIM43269.1 hypothetical protein [Hydrogenophaga sp.]NIN28337.1 hypothetical protein [Hydrogenophaga sp.]NIN29156.1 hypothetical protein [Hydrogenophaga sp.]NIN57472.1 hypothetical protein [Hydrogenophaga sp.]NIO53767.1 hypothetical protein [Hydrogenophaga sp.]